MGRSGYSDDYDEHFPNATYLYQANVDRALAGKCGQAFLKDLATQMDAMPVKRLITGQLEERGEVCTLGVMTRARGIDTSNLKFEYDENWGDVDDDFVIADLSGRFNIAECMVREVMYQNDEYWKPETPEERWQRMRNWVEKRIRSE